MYFSPLQHWADKHPIRWVVVLSAVVVLWIASGSIADKTKEYTDVYRAGLDAQAQESQELAHRRALQELCGGPEATVVDLANGGYACLDKDGRRTKVIHRGKS